VTISSTIADFAAGRHESSLNSFSSICLPPKLTGGFGRRRSLKHQWLYLHSLDSVATIRRLATF
jgi:hypothetical protein